VGVGCLARARHQGWAGFRPLLAKSFYCWSHQGGIQRSACYATTMNTAQKKSKTRDALMDVLLVLNSVILVFSHWSGPRK
jgi:hypothetical protein